MGREMLPAFAFVCVVLLIGSPPPAGAASCKTDQDCPLGSVCETKVTAVCDSPDRECVPGCRAGQRGCSGNLVCVDQVCKTCPCPDLCVFPQACGSRGLPPCPSGQFCNFLFDTCGGTDVGGVCAPLPDPKQCPGVPQPVCGCDGKTYRNICFANAAGVSAASTQPCPDPCQAPTLGIENAGFETGDLSGWNVEYAKNYDGQIKDKDWSEAPDDHPDPGIVTPTSALMPFQGQPIAPYCGPSMARINDLDGDRHATRLSREIQLPPVLSPCSVLRVRWGALLQDAGHPAAKQPFFRIEIKKDGKNLVERKFNASNAAAEGWKDIRKPGDPDPVWYKSEEHFLPLHNLDGESIEVFLIAADCTDGGHGGAAFIDCLEVIDRCSNPACQFPGQQPIPDPFIPNVFTPNGDGKNDFWTIKGIGPACRVRALITNRWGNTIATPVLDFPAAVPGGEVNLWEGIRNNGKPALEIENPYYYVLTVENCQGARGFPGFFYLYPCKADPVVSGPQTRKKKAQARDAAKDAWKAKVTSQLGGSWASWSTAKETSISCKKSKNKWTCEAKGKPCPG